MGTNCFSEFDFRALMLAYVITSLLAVAIVHLTYKRVGQWKKAAEEWRALAQQYSNAAFSERMARMQLEQWLTANGVDAPSAPEQKRHVH